MKNIIINDKVCKATEGNTVLEVARENGIDIPTLCYLKECGNVGKCGVCAVEIEGKNNLALACLTKVEDGMVVRTDTEKVHQEFQQYLISMNLSAVLALEEKIVNC